MHDAVADCVDLGLGHSLKAACVSAFNVLRRIAAQPQSVTTIIVAVAISRMRASPDWLANANALREQRFISFPFLLLSMQRSRKRGDSR